MLQCGEEDPSLFYTDRPRDGQLGAYNNEYISLFADQERLLEGRTPLECYADFMHAFRLVPILEFLPSQSLSSAFPRMCCLVLLILEPCATLQHN